MKPKSQVTSLNSYKRYSLRAQILDDPEMMSWFADLCSGESPKAKVSEEILALMEEHGLIRKTDFGWVLGAEGRQFARELEIIPGPSKFEINPSLVTSTKLEGVIEKPSKDSSKLSSTKTDIIDIDEIWEQFHENRDEYSRNLLMEHYRNIVKYSADRLHSKLPDKVELDDLVSAGIFGLMDAIDAFDPSRGVKFETYCSPRIRGSILDELRSMDWIPQFVRDRVHQLSKATHSLEIRLGRKPTEKEIAEELDMDTEEFTRLQRDTKAMSLVSLYTKYDDVEGEIDIIKDEISKNPIIEAQKRDLKSLLTKGLTRTERLIIVLYYYEEYTMKQIASTLGLSESRVSQMHSSIMARLKAQMRERKEYFKNKE